MRSCLSSLHLKNVWAFEFFQMPTNVMALHTEHIYTIAWREQMNSNPKSNLAKLIHIRTFYWTHRLYLRIYLQWKDFILDVSVCCLQIIRRRSTDLLINVSCFFYMSRPQVQKTYQSREYSDLSHATIDLYCSKRYCKIWCILSPYSRVDWFVLITLVLYTYLKITKFVCFFNPA